MKKVIVPAILEKSFDAIQGAIDRVRGVTKSVQIDIVDGVYADNATWPFVTGENDTSIEKLSEKQLADKAECLYDLRIPFEIDLMIQTRKIHSVYGS